MDAIDNPSYFSVAFDEFHSFNQPTSSLQTRSSRRIQGSRLTPSQAQMHSKTRSHKRTLSEDTDSLILGKPRPTDLAPSANKNHDQRNRNTGNVNCNDLHQDMVLCNPGDNDVFLTPSQSSQYYNTSTVPLNRILNANKRRHSLGSFMQQENRVLRNGKVNESKNQESRITRPNKLRKNFKGGVKMLEEELDIIFVSCGESKAATQWVNYLVSRFQGISKECKRLQFKLKSINFEDILYLSSSSLSSIYKLPEAKLKIFIICPSFLEKIKTKSVREDCLIGVSRSENIIALMLGVVDHLESGYVQSVFPNFEQWRKMMVKDQDLNFVGDFLGVSMDILNRKWHLQKIMTPDPEHVAFSLLPKKVNSGQNKLVALLMESLSENDIIRVFIIENTHKIEITGVKRRNPYTLQFSMPACYLNVSTLVNIRIEKNGQSLGKQLVKCESKIKELEQLIKSLDESLQFLCQSFGLNTDDKDQLDTFLADHFQKNTPVDFNLLAPLVNAHHSVICSEEFPTLLHFAARFGLEKLSWQLMEAPGGEQACLIQNNSHMTPADIAEKANYPKLASALKGFTQMTELTSVYNYLKRTIGKEKKGVEFEYLLPKPLDHTYLIPPTARPVCSFHGSFLVDSPPVSTLPCYANFKPCNFSMNTPQSPSETSSSGGYVSVFENYDVPCNGKPYTPNFSVHKLNSELMNMSDTETSRCSDTISSRSSSTGASHSETERTSFQLKSDANQCSNKEKLTPEEEFLEIINDFKNNVFSITEVESLVENWQNRKDVRQTFREKEEQLNKIREEYDIIQRKIKKSPFEKLRKFFGRAKNKESKNKLRKSVSDISSPQLRPISSLSLRNSQETDDFSDASSVHGSSSTVYSVKPCSVTSVSLEKLDVWKLNTSHEITQCSPCQDLIKNVDSIQNQFCEEDLSKLNTHQTCVVKVFPETIEECNEFNNTESVSINAIDADNCTLELNSGRKLHQSKSLIFISDELPLNQPLRKVKSMETLSEFFGTLGMKGEQARFTNHLGSSLPVLSDISLIKTLKFLSCSDLTRDVYNVLLLDLLQVDKKSMNSVSSNETVSNSGNCSSLDLSSLSLKSNSSLENIESLENQFTVKLHIIEGGTSENESAAPSKFYRTSESHANSYLIPEYINLNFDNSTTLKESCKYALVSS